MRMQALLTLLALTIATPATADTSWPLVATTSQSAHVAEAETDDPALRLDIRSPSGQGLYTLECHTSLYNDAQNRLAYSGLVQCYLFPFGQPGDYLLLSEATHDGQSADWTNRARFLPDHLLPACATNHDWGAHRAFRLRGMLLNLSITDVRFAPKAAAPSISDTETQQRIASYRITADVAPDRSAQTRHAAPALTPEPSWFYGRTACGS